MTTIAAAFGLTGGDLASCAAGRLGAPRLAVSRRGSSSAKARVKSEVAHGGALARGPLNCSNTSWVEPGLDSDAHAVRVGRSSCCPFMPRAGAARRSRLSFLRSTAVTLRQPRRSLRARQRRRRRRRILQRSRGAEPALHVPKRQLGALTARSRQVVACCDSRGCSQPARPGSCTKRSVEAKQ